MDIKYARYFIFLHCTLWCLYFLSVKCFCVYAIINYVVIVVVHSFPLLRFTQATLFCTHCLVLVVTFDVVLMSVFLIYLSSFQKQND
jgi:hypothetical protein